MEKVFKRSMWGYNPSMVDELIEKTDRDYRQKLLRLRKKLADEVQRTEQLKGQIRQINSSIEPYKSQEVEISQLLLESFLKASEAVYNLTLEKEQQEKDASNQIAVQRTQLVNLKSGVDNLKQDINTVINQYMSLREKAEGE